MTILQYTFIFLLTIILLFTRWRRAVISWWIKHMPSNETATAAMFCMIKSATIGNHSTKWFYIWWTRSAIATRGFLQFLWAGTWIVWRQFLPHLSTCTSTSYS